MNALTKTETGQAVAEQPAKPKNLMEQLSERSSQFSAALPAHIPEERFRRIVLTAVQNNPKLASADRQSLFNSCMRAAQDGLLPDGRDGALVIYSTKKKDANGRDVWVDAVQWMPMIGGIRKKVRNSGEIKDWNCQVVYAKDDFLFELGDEPFIKHKPYMGGDPGPVIAAYSVAQFKTGEKSREVMTRAQIDRVRQASRSKDKGPWVDWYDEMCRKTVARRHSKVLPMSSDLDDLIRRDDALYDLDAKSDRALAAPPKTLGDRLEMLASSPVIVHDTETGEVIDNEPADAPVKQISSGSGVPLETTTGEDHDPVVKQGAEVAGSFPAASAPKAEPPKAEQKAAPTASGAADRRAALLKDLTAQGDENAACGPRILKEWLDELNGDEQALLTAAQFKAWKDAAARVGQ